VYWVSDKPSGSGAMSWGLPTVIARVTNNLQFKPSYCLCSSSSKVSVGPTDAIPGTWGLANADGGVLQTMISWGALQRLAFHRSWDLPSASCELSLSPEAIVRRLCNFSSVG
jgi:hypothetical protein